MIAPLLAVAVLSQTGVPVQIQGTTDPPRRADQLAVILRIAVDMGVIPLSLGRVELPAPEKPGDPRELVLVADTPERPVLARLALVAATATESGRYAYEGRLIPVPAVPMLLAAPVETNWMRLTLQRKLSRTLKLELVRSESLEPVELDVAALKRPTGEDPRRLSTQAPAAWASGIPDLVARPEPGHYEISRGTWRIERDLVVPSAVTLHVAAGTTLLLDPGRSIFAYGKLHVEGTHEAPVTVRSGGVGPFGAVAILGEAASGSSFRGCRFERGSQGSAGLLDLNGTVTVADASLTIEDSLFQDCVGEDALHVERGDITVLRTRFVRIASDGVDTVEATGRMEHCAFTDIGDDAIDAGQKSRMTVERVVIQRAGGKAVSVGQGSTLELSESFLMESGRGLSSFEGSRVHVLTTAIAFSRRAGVQASARRGREAGTVAIERSLLWQNASEGSLGSDRVTLTNVRQDVPIDLALYAPAEGPGGVSIGPSGVPEPLPPLSSYAPDSGDEPKVLLGDGSSAAAARMGLVPDSPLAWSVVFVGAILLLALVLVLERRTRG